MQLTRKRVTALVLLLIVGLTLYSAAWFRLVSQPLGGLIPDPASIDSAFAPAVAVADRYFAALQNNDFDRASESWMPVTGPRLYEWPIRSRLETAGPIQSFRLERPLSVRRNFDFWSLDPADSPLSYALLYEVRHSGETALETVSLVQATPDGAPRITRHTWPLGGP